jgi:tRNA 2-thiouridine synthesizing protein A
MNEVIRMTKHQMSEHKVDLHVDASTLQCPLPLLKTRQALRQLRAGQLLEVIATDSGSANDIPAYLRQSCHALVRMGESKGCYYFVIRCGTQEP